MDAEIHQVSEEKMEVMLEWVVQAALPEAVLAKKLYWRWFRWWYSNAQISIDTNNVECEVGELTYL